MLLFKALYAPIFFLVFLSVGQLLIVNKAPLHSLLFVVAIMILTSFLAERIAPYQRDWNQSKGDRFRDFLHASVNETSVAASVLMVPFMAKLLSSNGFWPDVLPLWAQLGFAIVVADIGITLAHYASHKNGLLWKLHAPHHSVKRMYGFNGLVKHPVHQAIETVAGTTPLILLGMPIDIAALLSLAVTTQLLLQHSNVDMKLGPLRHIWAVAPVHRFHHVNKSEDGDVNFGLFLTLWDHLLGTAYMESGRIITSEELGIENEPNYPVEYLEQIGKPFKF